MSPSHYLLFNFWDELACLWWCPPLLEIEVTHIVKMTQWLFLGPIENLSRKWQWAQTLCCRQWDDCATECARPVHRGGNPLNPPPPCFSYFHQKVSRNIQEKSALADTRLNESLEVPHPKFFSGESSPSRWCTVTPNSWRSFNVWARKQKKDWTTMRQNWQRWSNSDYWAN